MPTHLVCFAFIEGWASNLDPACITNVIWVNHDFEWRVLDVLAVALHRDLMLSNLSWGEGDSIVALWKLLEEARLLNARRRHNECLQ